MNADLDPNGPRYGVTHLQESLLRHYETSTQRDAMEWPRAANQCTSVRALVRRRLLSRNGDSRLFISQKGLTALSLRPRAA